MVISKKDQKFKINFLKILKIKKMYIFKKKLQLGSVGASY